MSALTHQVAVIGGGEFGRSLALASARAGNDVVLVSRSAHDLPERVTVSADRASVAGARLIFLAVPSEHVDALAQSLDADIDGRHMVVHVSRGLLAPDLRTLSQVVRERTACRKVGALAGPLVPESLATALPGGAVVGTPFPEVTDAVRAAIGHETLRVYHTTDLLGVEVASALVGVLSLALGVAEGLGVGAGALAMLATRGMAEAGRIGVALGAKPETFGGLAGFGDLMACAAGDGRAEYALGKRAAEGAELAAAIADGQNVEGVRLAGALSRYAALHELDAPIIDACAALVAGDTDAPGALASLMAREAAKE